MEALDGSFYPVLSNHDDNYDQYSHIMILLSSLLTQLKVLSLNIPLLALSVLHSSVRTQ
jgi:hypothetical protein